MENAFIPQNNTYGKSFPGFLFQENTAKYSPLKILTHCLLQLLHPAACLFLIIHTLIPFQTLKVIEI
jgi:hypothetical protein